MFQQRLEMSCAPNRYFFGTKINYSGKSKFRNIDEPTTTDRFKEETKKDIKKPPSLKSISAKLRHAAKTEHHKYEYDEKTGKVHSKDDLSSLRHMKGMSDSVFLTELFLKKEFQSYLHTHYQIVPILINRNRIRKVRP